MHRASSVGTLDVDQPSASATGTEFNASNNLRAMHADDHEYVQAMLEDLCDWFNKLYSLKLTADTFIAALDNGVLLCRLASLVQSHAKTYFDRLKSETERTAHALDSSGEEQLSKIKIGHNLVKLPKAAPSFNGNATSGTFFARDNISNFISWCKHFGVPPYFMFETNDIVLRRNVKNVLLCLLVIARIGSEFGIDVPDLIKLEQEIDSEEACLLNGEELSVDAEEMERLNVQMLREQEIQHRLIVEDQEHKRMLLEQQLAARQLHERQQIEQQQELMKMRQVEMESLRRIKLKNQRLVDMRTLDEVIREMISDCSCDMPILMKKVAPGKYQFGEEKTMIFVRVLRNHIMVRVGGGWDTFECFLWKHDPCRRHRSRDELQQRAAEVLQKQREIFYCDESDQSGASQVLTKRTPMLSTSRTTNFNQSDSAVVPLVSAIPRSRARPSSAMGESRLDVPDGAIPINGPLISPSAVPLVRPQSALAAPRVRRKTAHVFFKLEESNQSSNHQPNASVGANELNAPGGSELAESAAVSALTNGNAQAEFRQLDDATTHTVRVRKLPTIEINNVGGVSSGTPSKLAPNHSIANPRVAHIRRQTGEHPAPQRKTSESRTTPIPKNQVITPENAVSLFQPIRPASPVSSMSPTPSTDSDTNSAQNAIQVNKSRMSKPKGAQAAPKSNLMPHHPTASSAPNGNRSHEALMSVSGQNSSRNTKQALNKTLPVFNASSHPRPLAKVPPQRASPPAAAQMTSTVPKTHTAITKNQAPTGSRVMTKSVSSISPLPFTSKLPSRKTSDTIAHQKATNEPERHTRANEPAQHGLKFQSHLIPQTTPLTHSVSVAATSPSFADSPHGEAVENGLAADTANLSPSTTDSGMSSDIVSGVNCGSTTPNCVEPDSQNSVSVAMKVSSADILIEKRKTIAQCDLAGSSYPNSKLPVSTAVHRSRIPLPQAHA